MDYSSGYTASYYASFVDPITFDDYEFDSGRIELVNGSINRDNSILRQSASVSLRNNYNEVNDQWIRIYMVLRQGNDMERIPLFTGLASSPNINYNLGVQERSLECYSVLKVAEDVILPRGWYAAKGENVATIMYNLLSVIPAPLTVAENAPNLETTVVAENNENNLSMIDYIVTLIDWQIQIDGNGSIYIGPRDETPVDMFSSEGNDIIEASSFTIGRDWFSCPNVMSVTSGQNTAIYRDDDPDSDLSTVSRGREIWASEDGVALEDGQTLASYARDKLAELQTRTETVQYTRRFLPYVMQGDTVRINYADIQGDYYIESQSINLTASGQTSENVYKIYGDGIW